MPMLPTMMLAATLSGVPQNAVASLPVFASTAEALEEPEQIDDFPTFPQYPGVFMATTTLLEGPLECFVYCDGQTVAVGERVGRRVDVVIPCGLKWDWMLTGALRTDSNGDHYIRAYAKVNDVDAEVAVYSLDAIFECETGYQVLPQLQPGSFQYDAKHPGEPWTSWRAFG